MGHSGGKLAGSIIATPEVMATGRYAQQQERHGEPLQRRLADFNRLRHAPCLVDDAHQHLRQEQEARALEGHFVDGERDKIKAAAAAAPTQPGELIDWFDGLREVSAHQSQAFYQWLAELADRDAVAWLLTQEMAGGEALEDLLALTQLQMPWRSKLEIARCYWDEMGQGEPSAMRSRIVEGIARELFCEVTQPCVVEVLARSNLMHALAANRHYAYQSVGALGVMELGMAGPARMTSLALKRLGFSLEAVAYFASRSKLSILRAHSWAYDVILPLVADDARVARAVAEGALMRLAAEASCIQRYERELGRPHLQVANPEPLRLGLPR
jgi:Iron-containing redox enzyme